MKRFLRVTVLCVAVLVTGCSEPGPSEPWRTIHVGGVEIQLPASIEGAPTEDGWRGASQGVTRCGPTVVTLRHTGRRRR
ncbi:MAG: hypothetical protein AB8I08_05775 [Sandaracinaceae bacterium]